LISKNLIDELGNQLLNFKLVCSVQPSFFRKFLKKCWLGCFEHDLVFVVKVCEFLLVKLSHYSEGRTLKEKIKLLVIFLNSFACLFDRRCFCFLDCFASLFYVLILMRILGIRLRMNFWLVVLHWLLWYFLFLL